MDNAGDELKAPPPNERRNRLAEDLHAPQKKYNARYSTIVRRLRLIFPMIAVAIIAVIFTWDNNPNLVQTIKEEAKKVPTVGKNELLTPHFESVDSKNQPFTITAKRALRGQTNDDLLILEDPKASITLNNNQRISVSSLQGAYRQDTKRLLLKNNIILTHDLGYEFKTEEMNVDLNTNDAWSTTEILAQGPKGTLHAQGMEIQSDHNTIIFSGPAKLTLHLDQNLGDI